MHPFLRSLPPFCSILPPDFRPYSAVLSCCIRSHCRSRCPVWASGDNPAREEAPCRGRCRRPAPAPLPRGRPVWLLSHPPLPRAPPLLHMRILFGYCRSRSHCRYHGDCRSRSYFRSHIDCRGHSYFHSHSYFRTSRYRSRSQTVTIK